MSAGPSDPRGALRWALAARLAHAVEAYGPDLPLRVRVAAAPAEPPAVTDDPGEAPGAPPRDLPNDLAALGDVALQCTRCKLAAGRKNVVFGEGSPDARVMFIGEGPGAREDAEGRPFVGPAGQLLTRIIENAMGLRRADVYIANVVKCRPPGNRNPEPDEVAACAPFLRAQIDLIGPEVIVLLGRVAAQAVLRTPRPMRSLRGATLECAGIPVVVTWHPAYLLRQPAAKREAWEDVKRVNRLLGLPEVPARG